MKPTPPARPSWPLVSLILAGFAATLPWGCGQSRQIVYPGRKVSPPRVLKAKLPGSRWKSTAPIEEGPRAEPKSRPGAPTSIDVPIIDRNGRENDPQPLP